MKTGFRPSGTGRVEAVAQLGEVHDLRSLHAQRPWSATGLPTTVVAARSGCANRRFGIADAPRLGDAAFRRDLGVEAETYEKRSSPSPAPLRGRSAPAVGGRPRTRRGHEVGVPMISILVHRVTDARIRK
jgi:hypothetical protein